MENHISTTIEQSKHLLELGLDPKTADMYYLPQVMNEGETLWPIDECYDLDDADQPAWSLSALLEVMPMVNEGWPVCCKIYGSEKWHVLYHSTAVTPKIDSGEYDTPIEAAYELVCCLLEQGLIEKGDNDESES